LDAPFRYFKTDVSIGSLRRRLPVAAKIALVTAGGSADVPGSPIPAARFSADHDVNVNLRHLVHRKSLVAVEIGLLDAPVLHRDLAMKRRRKTIDDGALDLRLDRVWIDGDPAIDSAHDAFNADFTHFRDIDLRDLGHESPEHGLDRCATAGAIRSISRGSNGVGIR